MSTPPRGARAYTKKSDLGGNGMFASEDVPIGESLFEMRPLVSALDVPRLHDTCANCFSSASDSNLGSGEPLQLNLQTCTGCKTNRYCSKQCQTESWKRQHQYECKMLKMFPSTGQLPNAVRAVLQMLRSVTDWDSSPYKQMTTHLDEMIKQGGDRYDNILTLSTGIYHYAKARTPIELLHVCFALCFTNSLSLYTPTYDALGIAIDPFVSSANHSCEPNVITVWDGPLLTFRTLRPLRKGEEVFITYVDASHPFGRRQFELQDRYYFKCMCSKCVRNSSSRKEDFQTLPNPDFNEQLKSMAEDRMIAAKTCFRGANAAAFDMSKLRDEGDLLGGGDAAFEALSAIQKLGFAATTAVKNTAAPIKFLNIALDTCLDTGIWPEDRQPVPLLRQEKFVILLQQERFLDAFREGARLCLHSWPFMYPQKHHPQLVVHLWTLAKLCLYIAGDQGTREVKELQSDYGFGFDIIGVKLLLEIDKVVDMSHGKGSSFAKCVRDKMCEAGVDDNLKNAGQSLGMGRHFEDNWAGLRRMVTASSPKGRLVSSS